jgi:hypothetical protein
VLEAQDGQLCAKVVAGCEDEAPLELARGSDKVAIDAPFGWPNEFIDVLNARRRLQAGWRRVTDRGPRHSGPR